MDSPTRPKPSPTRVSYATVLDCLPLAILVFDQDQRILWTNRALLAATGLAPESLVGHEVTAALALPLAPKLSRMLRTLDDGYVWLGTVALRNPRGEAQPMAATLSALPNEGAEFRLYVASFSSVTIAPIEDRGWLAPVRRDLAGGGTTAANEDAPPAS